MEGFAETPDALLRVQLVSKSFGAVVALQDASLHVPTGEITGLVGDNGAGKSTLIKMISGMLMPDSGSIEFLGKPADFASPADAREQGVETVYQDLALAGNLAVWANLYLGRELTIGPKILHILDKRAMLSRTGAMLERFIRNVPPIAEPVELLSGGQRQVVAIAARRRLGVETHSHGRADSGARGHGNQGGRRRDFRNEASGADHIGYQPQSRSDLPPDGRRLGDGRGRVIGYRQTAEAHPDEIVSMITGAAASAKPRA